MQRHRVRQRRLTAVFRVRGWRRKTRAPTRHPPARRFRRHWIAAADLIPSWPHGPKWAMRAAGPPLDFRRLAVDAGLGWLSRTGLLLHPEHGLWLGLRAALFTTRQLPTTSLPPGPGPCVRCDAPCISACPGDAMTRVPTPEQPSAWDWRTCATFRVGRPCHARCDVRNACPEGTESRYTDRAQAYHNDPAGRVRLAAAFEVASGSGADPGWKD